MITRVVSPILTEWPILPFLEKHLAWFDGQQAIVIVNPVRIELADNDFLAWLANPYSTTKNSLR